MGAPCAAKDSLYLTPSEVAKLLLVAPVTVRQWAHKGWLRAERTAGGHRRYLKQEVERFARERGLTLHQENEESGLRLLVVDDDAQFAGYLQELLKEQPGVAKVLIAGNGFEAGILTYKFHPHVVLLDLMMPGLDGFAVCRQIKQDPTTRRIRVIAMTGYATGENRQRILEAGAEQCLAKPFESQQLLEAIGLTRTTDPFPNAASI
jgi:excisionase family DNA binding protein